MKRKDYINKIKEKMKDPITKRKKYTSDDAVIDDAVFYYFDELKHSGRLQWNVSDINLLYELTLVKKTGA